jgi:hypothetical protein
VPAGPAALAAVLTRPAQPRAERFIDDGYALWRRIIARYLE